MEGHAHSGI